MSLKTQSGQCWIPSFVLTFYGKPISPQKSWSGVHFEDWLLHKHKCYYLSWYSSGWEEVGAAPGNSRQKTSKALLQHLQSHKCLLPDSIIAIILKHPALEKLNTPSLLFEWGREERYAAVTMPVVYPALSEVIYQEHFMRSRIRAKNYECQCLLTR